MLPGRETVDLRKEGKGLSTSDALRTAKRDVSYKFYGGTGVTLWEFRRGNSHVNTIEWFFFDKFFYQFSITNKDNWLVFGIELNFVDKNLK